MTIIRDFRLVLLVSNSCTFAGAAGVLALITALLVSPDLRVLAQDILDFFIPGEPVRPISILVGGEGEASNDPYSLSMEQLRAQADTPLYLPMQLPEGYTYAGGDYHEERLTVTYRCGERDGIGLTLHQIGREQVQRVEVGESAEIIDVTINDIPAQYVRGAWIAELITDPAPGGRTTVPGQAVWTNDSDFQQLWWYEESIGTHFNLSTLSGSMYGRAVTDCTLSMEDFIAIVESVTPATP